MRSLDANTPSPPPPPPQGFWKIVSLGMVVPMAPGEFLPPLERIERVFRGGCPLLASLSAGGYLVRSFFPYYYGLTHFGVAPRVGVMDSHTLVWPLELG